MQQYLTNPLSISQAKKKGQDQGLPRHLSGYIGVDEAGRGCLAGPVVAAAVWLPPKVSLNGLTDSKKLNAKQRQHLAALVKEQALCWSLGFVWPREIDRINILQAAFLAMGKALCSLPCPKNLLSQNILPPVLEGTLPPVLQGILIDGPYTIAPHHLKSALRPYAGLAGLWPQNLLLLPQQAVVKGDSLVLAIAAASVLAKTARDKFMQRIDRLFPAYGFAQHKGYATATHVEALHTHGPCRMHRLSFKY